MMKITKEKTTVEVEDSEIMRIISTKAGYYSAMNRIPSDDLVSLGDEVLIEAIDKWNPDKSKFLTFLYRVLDTRMLNYVKRENKRVSNMSNEFMAMTLVTNITPRDILEAKDKQESMSRDASFVAITVMSDPDVFGLIGNERNSVSVRKKIKDVLRSEYGWTKRRVASVFTELMSAYS